MQTHESQEHIEDTSKPEKTEHKEEATDHEQYNQSLSSSGDGTREARIALRKNRIQAARVAKSRVENTEGINNNNPVSENSAKPTNEPERKDAGKSQNQITVSKKRMDATKLSGTENVTQVRVSVVAREAQRRVEEAKKVDQWDLKRRQEMEKTSEMQNSIEEEWKKSFKIATPGKLYELLIEQKTACNELIATKNRLINEHVIELKTKDDEYVKELKRQAEEIDTVLARMEAQYKTFQKTLNQEIEQIERAFVEERSELLHKNSNEIENLFTSRRENERKFMEERGERMEDHIQQLEQLRIHDAEEYNLVKIKLETDVKVLEQQLQQMRGTYQLNTEKLDYNFQVLKKREEENGAILSAQKRKIARLSDHLNVLKSKIQKQEKSFQQEYISLTDDYKRITDQFKELQKKFRHFQMADSKRYRQVWAMNEEMAKEKLRKVLQADRIIHEQQLGLEWKAPDDDIFKSETVIQEKPIEKVKELNGAAVLLPLIISEHDDDENGDEIKESFGMKLTRKSYSNTMKNMLELLCNEAGFLVFLY